MNAQPIGLVTGASGGIGHQAIARELAPKYRLVLVASNTDKLGQLAAQLARAETIALDLSTPLATRPIQPRTRDAPSGHQRTD